MRTGLLLFVLPILLSASSAVPIARQVAPDSRPAPRALQMTDVLAQTREMGADRWRPHIEAFYKARDYERLFIDAGGVLQFRADLYDRDQRHPPMPLHTERS